MAGILVASPPPTHKETEAQKCYTSYPVSPLLPRQIGGTSEPSLGSTQHLTLSRCSLREPSLLVEARGHKA